MKKSIFSFRTLRIGSYLHRFFLGTSKHRVARNLAIAAIATVGVSINASAQCTTFLNADAANPLISVFPAGKKPSALDFADINGDGLQDCYVRFDNDTMLTLYRNTGTATHPVFKQSDTTGFTNDTLPHGPYGYYEANQYMQFVDIDGDGDLDFFITDQNYDQYDYYATTRIKYYENIGTNKVPDFIEKKKQNPVAFASSSYFVPFKLVDIDGDGDYDLYYNDLFQYGNYSYPAIYMNTGTKYVPHYVLYTDDYCNCSDRGRTYYDWNKDGLLDYFTIKDGSYTGDYKFVNFHKNVGTKAAPQYVNDNKDKPRFNNGVPYRITDLNNDGTPEVFNATAHYSTLAPVAKIVAKTAMYGNKQVTVLQSKDQNNNYIYRWERNGKTIPGATDYFIQAKQPGTYTLYITDLCGTGVSLNYEFTKTTFQPLITDSKMANLTSISNITAKAYPNPFVNAITLQLSGAACIIKVTDMAGRVLITQTTSASSLQVGERLKAGTYIIEVFEDKKLIYRTTVLKQ